MRNLLRFFGLLDVVCIVLASGQVYAYIMNFNHIPNTLVFRTIVVLRVLVFLSLPVTALGNIMLKRYGAIAYYVQFVFRIVTLMLSFGFITLLGEYFTGEAAVRLLLATAIFGEFIRIYYTVRAHQNGLLD